MRKYGPPSGKVPPKGPARPLSDMQDRFAHEYVIDLNATAAAKRAGYSAKAAHVSGPRLLQKAGVRSLVDRLLEERRAKAKMTADEVHEELARLARSRVSRYFDDKGVLKSPHEWGDDADAAVASIEVRVEQAAKHVEPEVVTKLRLWEKTAALRMLAQIHGLIGADVQVNLGAELAEKLAAARKRRRTAA